MASRAASPTSLVRAYLGDNPWGSLHALPTFYVVAGSMFVSLTGTYLLQHHVVSTQDHYGVFVVGVYLVFCSYFMVYFFLQRGSTSFRKISQEKKFYVIANLIKAGVLCAITPFAVFQLYYIVRYDRWDTNLLRNMGCIYAIPDFVSLLVVRRMALATTMHHLCVCVFNFFSIQNDYSEHNICRLVVVYAAFSTFAYCVNMLLASRFLGVSRGVSQLLSMTALVVYVLCCTINWAWQVHYIRILVRDHNHWTIYLYMVLICFVMWDDITLNRWLLQNARSWSRM